MTLPDARDRLIIGLDLPRIEDARKGVAAIGDAGAFYKIGLQLIPIGGVDFARELIGQGRRVFLDFKLYDIPATVTRAVRNIAPTGASFLTVHGDRDIMAAAIEGRGDADLKILAVTVLTSLDDGGLRELGYGGRAADLVMARAEAAAAAGCDGVIASALEASALKARFGEDFLVVTPGIRPAGAARDDQQRVATPAAALAAGADYLVMSRPILSAADPRAAALAVLAEMRGAARR